MSGMFDLRAKQQMNHGFGNAYGRGFEIVITPLIFGGLGALIDRAVGTHLVFMIGLATFAVAGMFVRMWLGYDTEMRRHEQEILGLRRGKASITTSTSSSSEEDAA